MTAVAEPKAGVPRHVAIIMDGNGRWAKKRMLPRVAGHRAGVEAVRKIVRAAGEQGVQALTLYAFSSENWKRPEQEVSDLMGLMKRFILSDLDEFAANGIRLHIIGDYRAFVPDVVELIDGALARTRANTRMTVTVALNYGAHDELVRVTRRLAEAGGAQAITADAIDAALDTAPLPPLDLLIRTSGECRLSNFLLWQAAYAELLFVDTLWPDFGPDQLAAAIADFGRRERRYGGL